MSSISFFFIFSASSPLSSPPLCRLFFLRLPNRHLPIAPFSFATFLVGDPPPAHPWRSLPHPLSVSEFGEKVWRSFKLGVNDKSGDYPHGGRQQVTVDSRLAIWAFGCPKTGVNPHSEYEPIRTTAKYVSLCCHPICCYNIFFYRLPAMV